MFSQLNTFLYFALIKRQLELSTAKKLSQSCFKLIVNEPTGGAFAIFLDPSSIW